MADRLATVVLGNRNSGKSTTWNHLFNATVRTGKYPRRLYLNAAQSVDVFLISGSPEEKETEVASILPNPLPQIVLCSVQYRGDALDTFRYFLRNGYELFVQWLNPGYSDGGQYTDDLGLRDFLLAHGATLQRCNGTHDARPRISQIRQYLLGWATYHDVVCTAFPA